jgi:hypothetical protein
MDLDASVIGQMLDDVPLGAMVENLGVAIATAQERLDNVAIEATMRLANTTATLYDAGGQEVTRSLLELGFTPTFYQFTEATIEVSFVATMQVAEVTSVGFGLRLGGSIASADQAAERLAELDKQEKALDSDMAQKKEKIEKDREDTLEQLETQRDKFDELLKKNRKDGKQ